MRVGMIGTGAISHKHAQAYKNIGFQLTVCTDIFEAGGRRFAEQYGAEFVPTYEEVCRHPKVDYVDVCTFPDFRMQPIAVCAETGKHVPLLHLSDRAERRHKHPAGWCARVNSLSRENQLYTKRVDFIHQRQEVLKGRCQPVKSINKNDRELATPRILLE